MCRWRHREWGTITADICYGGVFYALVDVGQVGLTIIPRRGRTCRDRHGASRRIYRGPSDGSSRDTGHQRHCLCDVPAGAGVDGETRTATIMPPGRLDRSPCGTGSSAHLASLHAREGYPLARPSPRARSSTRAFEVTLTGVTEIAGRHGDPAADQRARLALWRDGDRSRSEDIFADGYAVSDVWGPDAGKL